MSTHSKGSKIPTSLHVYPFLKNELFITNVNHSKDKKSKATISHPDSVATAVIPSNGTLTLRWSVDPPDASDSVRIELYQLQDSHAVFRGVITKRATNGTFPYVLPKSIDGETNLYFIFRSRKKRASNVMGVSDIFDVAMHSLDVSSNPTVGSTAKRQSERRNTWSKSAVVDPVESCGKGWDLISCNSETSATIMHLESGPLSTFRCKNPVMAADDGSTRDRLVQGSYYFKRRLAYFEVEFDRMTGNCTVGWASQHHPMCDTEVGTTFSSVGYRNDGRMLTMEAVDGGRDWLLEHQEQEYSETDVIGCGLDCQTGCVFFTKNGNLLSLPFSIELGNDDTDGDNDEEGDDNNSSSSSSSSSSSASKRRKESIWPVISADGQVKVRVRMQSRLKFNGFYEVFESMKKRPSSIRHHDRSSLRTRSQEESERKQKRKQKRQQERRMRKEEKEKRDIEQTNQKQSQQNQATKQNHNRNVGERIESPKSSSVNPEEDGDSDESDVITQKLMANRPQPPPPTPPPPPSAANISLKKALASQNTSSATASIATTATSTTMHIDKKGNTSSNTISNVTASTISTESAGGPKGTISSWSTTDVADWLSSYDSNLSRYVSTFSDIGVDGEMLVHMNDTDLKEDLNVKIRLHRVKILGERDRLVLAENLFRGGNSTKLTGGESNESINTWSSPSQSHKSSSINNSQYENYGNSNTSSFQSLSRSNSKLARETSDSSSFISNNSSNDIESYDDNVGNSITDFMAITHLTNTSSSNKKRNNTKQQEEIQKRKSTYATDIFALFSSPLVDGGKKPIHKLAHEKEMQIMCASLRKAGKNISLTMSHATTDAMCTAVTLGCQVLHYSGHADQSSLAFEDSNGRLHRLDIDRLGDLFGRRVGSSSKDAEVEARTSSSVHGAASITATNKASNLTTGFPPLPTLVFVSACHSEEAGNAFLRAGAELVVAVEIDSKLEDLAAHAFTRAFYLALATGNSVESSFHIGQAAVQAAPGRSKEAATSEAKKFKLMGSGSKDVKIFSYLNDGSQQYHYNSETKGENEFIEPSSLIRDVIPVVPEGFVGRRVEMYSIIKLLKLHRTVSIVGDHGIGKSVVAIAAANYMSARNIYRDGIFYVRCQHDDDVESLSVRLLAQWYDRDLRCESESRRQSSRGRSTNGGRRNTSSSSSPFLLIENDGSRRSSSNLSYHAPHNSTSAENELLILLRNVDCLCVLDQASGAVGMFVQTIVERTSGVRFLLATTQRSLADEHSVALHGLTPESAVRMFVRRCPRENLRVSEVPMATDPNIKANDLMGRLRCALTNANILSPGSIMRVCARMRDPNGLSFIESVKKEVEERD
jgi:hypothetical protein